MAPTPTTSFSSDEGQSRGRKRRRGHTPPILPSPARALPSPESKPPSDVAVAHNQPDRHQTDTEHKPNFPAEDEPQIQAAFNAIYDVALGLVYSGDDHPFLHFSGGQASFDELERRCENDPDVFGYWGDKLRFHWNPETGDLFLRLMPTLVHNSFVDRFADLITEELYQLRAKVPELRDLLSNLLPAPAGSILLRNKELRESTKPSTTVKYPDYAWRSRSSAQPHIVLEVAYSEAEKKLKKKVHEYYKRSYKLLDAVMVVDIAYNGKKEEENPDGTLTVTRPTHDASVSIWRATDLDDDEENDEDDEDGDGDGDGDGEGSEYADKDGETDVDRETPFKMVYEEVFRKQGQPAKGSLDIPFDCFFPVAERHKIPDCAPATISISFADMASALESAEQDQLVMDNPRLLPRPPKRRRSNKGWRVNQIDSDARRRTTSHDIAIADAYRPQEHVVTRSRAAQAEAAQAVAARPALRPRRSGRLRERSGDHE